MVQKNIFVLMLGVIVVSLLMVNAVSAVGIKWFTESELVTEGEDVCIPYGAYNPSSQDILVNVEITDGLIDVVKGSSSEETFVPANTASKDSKEIRFCFTVPEVYEPDCLIAGMVCEQVCEGERSKFSGEVVMTERAADAEGSSGAGSGISLSASAPLSLEVACNAYPRNYTPVYSVGIALVAILLVVAIYRKNSNKKSKKKRK